MAHLTIEERFRIYEMNKSGYSSRYIGAKIDRDKSTVCYELRKMSGNYRPDKAHEFTILARTNKKKRKLDLGEPPRDKPRGIKSALSRGQAALAPYLLSPVAQCIF